MLCLHLQVEVRLMMDVYYPLMKQGERTPSVGIPIPPRPPVEGMQLCLLAMLTANS